MRIVADTNLFIASIFWSGAPCDIVQQALEGKIEIIVSQAILNKVRKVLKDPTEKFALSEQETDDIVDCIRLYAHVINPTVAVDVVRDPKDNHIIACALAAKADCIVTRDKDLLVLKEHSRIRIMTPEEFIQAIKSTKQKNQYDEFLHKIQQPKMKELWGNPADENLSTRRTQSASRRR